MSDTFSVVIPTRDRAGAIAAVVERVARLDSAPEEIVVVDDGSVDDTLTVLGALASRLPTMQVVSGRGTGPASARNVGAARGTGEWLVFLDDDDEPDPEWMTALRHLAADSPTTVSHVSVAFRVRRDGTLREMGVEDLGPAFGDAHANVLAGTFAIRRVRFEELGGFLEGLRHMEFTELALRLFDGSQPPDIGLRVDETSRLTIVARPIGDRVSQSPEVLVETGLRLLASTDRLWRRDPSRYADQLATFGVAAWRAGRPALGRRWLARAFALRPTDWRHATRAAVSLLPPLARRVWPAEVRSR